MADIWTTPPRSFIRCPLAALAYPDRPENVMEHMLDWSLLHVGQSIGRKDDVALQAAPDLLRELKKKRPDLWEKYQPKTWDEGAFLLGSIACNVDLGGTLLAAAVRKAEELTAWLIKTGAMRQAGSWEGVNTFTMTMNGQGERDSWWDSVHGVRNQGRGRRVNRQEGQLSWDEFRVYAAILSVTGERGWGRCTREGIVARAAGWVGVEARLRADQKEIERRKAAGLLLTDKAVRVKVDYLENSGRLAKVRYGYRTVYFGIGMKRDELWQKIEATEKKRALATQRAPQNRQSDLERTKALRREIAAAKGKDAPLVLTEDSVKAHGTIREASKNGCETHPNRCESQTSAGKRMHFQCETHPKRPAPLGERRKGPNEARTG